MRMLVADVDADLVSAVDRDREITRLGQAVDATGRLRADAITRTAGSIERMVSHARGLGAEHVRIAGTSALRDAGDSETFLDVVRTRTGLDVEVLDGQEEGRLAYLGATSHLPAGDYVVCDVGGGSTELSTVDDSVSLDVGSVRLTERFLHGDPPTPAEIGAARAFVDELLSDVTLPAGRSLVGVAGTITTMAAIVLGLHDYDSDVVHCSVLSRSDVAATSDRLLTMPATEIAARGPVERGRADVIGGGSLVLRAVMERWAFEHVLVSERDTLDGLVADLAQKLA